jgi:hypothetical protein
MTQRASIVALLTALAAVSVVSSHDAFAQSCVIQNPQHYLLASDAVDWSMQVASGKSCLHGLRIGSVLLEKVSLIAPPESGNVQLVGPAFRYTAKDGLKLTRFRGHRNICVQGVHDGEGETTLHP